MGGGVLLHIHTSRHGSGAGMARLFHRSPESVAFKLIYDQYTFFVPA